MGEKRNILRFLPSAWILISISVFTQWAPCLFSGCTMGAKQSRLFCPISRGDPHADILRTRTKNPKGQQFMQEEQLISWHNQVLR